MKLEDLAGAYERVVADLGTVYSLTYRPTNKARDGRWTLEFEREQPLRPDPLTGWAGSGDTKTQVRLTFATRDEAVAYATKKGFAIHLVPAPPVKLKLQAYADNFR